MLNRLGQISAKLAKAGINFHNMMNKSRGELAYTLADADSVVPPGLVSQIAAIADVLLVSDLPLHGTCMNFQEDFWRFMKYFAGQKYER